eukprot:7366016-Pyramimonas_sp.AAC.2
MQKVSEALAAAGVKALQVCDPSPEQPCSWTSILSLRHDLQGLSVLVVPTQEFSAGQRAPEDERAGPLPGGERQEERRAGAAAQHPRRERLRGQPHRRQPRALRAPAARRLPAGV